MMADLDEDLPVLSFAGPGDYRLHVHARGRDTAIDLAPDEVTEWHLIQAWPAPTHDVSVLRPQQGLRSLCPRGLTRGRTPCCPPTVFWRAGSTRMTTMRAQPNTMFSSPPGACRVGAEDGPDTMKMSSRPGVIASMAIGRSASPSARRCRRDRALRTTLRVSVVA
ncbi:hypothetical protein ACFU53_34735 [Streptomyces sp. NPDC057474]|uniref:hypothetical protein n=1 Tax=Streptomyces sp. NPDC057474 TaxID=3346144 RepID=UPI0036C98E05